MFLSKHKKAQSDQDEQLKLWTLRKDTPPAVLSIKRDRKI